jgi:cyanoexosortase B-associated protein
MANNWSKNRSIPAMSQLKIKKTISLPQLALIILLVVVIVMAAVPSYLSGKWSWADLPQVTDINRMKNIRKTGLNLPGWKTVEQKEILPGGNQWSYQRLEQAGRDPVELWLMPQDYYKNHPQVEWTDLDGVERWKTDSQRILQLQAPDSGSDRISARFFRAWNRRTFAVVQWYAWPGGGHYSSWQWFFADQWAQLHRRRVPWIAASIKIQIDPLGDLDSTEALAQSLGETVQAILEKEIFGVSSHSKNFTDLSDRG